MTTTRSTRGPGLASALGILILTLLALVVPVPRALAAGSVMFASKGVSDKPQSKLWYNDGFWWGCFDGSTKLSIYKLENNTWTAKLDVQNAVTPYLKGGTNDALWDGTNLFVAAYDSMSSKFYKYSYNSTTKTYALLTGFPVSLTMRPGSETIVITKEAAGRIWLTYEAERKIYVQWTSTADHKTWYATPYAISDLQVDPDDISTIVTIGSDRIGVLWTDQTNQRVCFRVHRNADAGNVWQPIEVVRSGWGVIDDHINAKVDSQGRVFFAAKDYYDAVWVARREVAGTWTVTTGASGLDCGTRPIIQLDETNNKMYVFYTRWETCVSAGTHAIEERVSYMDNMLFSLPAVVISATNVSMNDVTGTKQILPAGDQCILAAGSDGKAYWGGWGTTSAIGGSDPGGAFPPPPLAPASVASATVSESARTRLALYRMEDAGGTLADASGNGNTLTLGTGINTPHWTPGITGNALYFDGDDYARTSGSGLQFQGASFTLEAWVKQDLTNSAGTGAIFVRGDSLHLDYMLSLTANQIALEWSVNDTMNVSVKATGPFLDGAWHHVAAVWDSSNAQSRIYIDGVTKITKAMLPAGVSGSWKTDMGCLVLPNRLDKQLHGTIDLAAVAKGVAYTGDFTPPLLYPASTQKYVRLTWTPPTSPVGISGFALRRGVNGGTPVALTNPRGATAWFADFTPPDGYLLYYIAGIDGLTQKGDEASVNATWESTPPAVPSVPLSVAWTPGTATVDGPAFWELNQLEGSTAEDGTGTGHSMQLGSSAIGDAAEPAWEYGMSGPCLYLDGTNDYTQVADAADLRFTGSYTIEAWVRRDKVNAQQAILNKDGGSSARNYGMTILSSNKVEFSWARTSGSTRKTTSTATITDLNWHHIACTHDAAGTDKIYIDGVLAGSASNSGTPYTGTQPVLVGARTPGALADFFKGNIDLVRISNGLRYTGTFTPPTLYQGGPRRHTVQLTWGLPTSGLVITYNVYRQPLPSGSATKIASVSVNTPWITDTGVSMGASYRYTIKAANSAGTEGVASTALDVAVPGATDANGPPVASGPRLRVEPNPFNPQAYVSFRLDASGPVQLELYDARGRRLETLVAGVLPAGVHRMPVLRPEIAAHMASGVYFVRLRADGQDTRIKAVLLK